MTDRVSTAVLISGNGSNLQALIDAAAAPDYPARIMLVIANKAEAYGLQRAQAANIPTRVISHKAYLSRDAFDEALDAALRESGCELVCLAGFMRLLTPGFVTRWQGRMLNIHPSLLPAYKGLNTHERVIADGQPVTGCTAHYVEPEMDAGPIILQEQVPVMPDDTPQTLQQRVHTAEHQLYPDALARVCGTLRSYETI